MRRNQHRPCIIDVPPALATVKHGLVAFCCCLTYLSASYDADGVYCRTTPGTALYDDIEAVMLHPADFREGSDGGLYAAYGYAPGYVPHSSLAGADDGQVAPYDRMIDHGPGAPYLTFGPMHDAVDGSNADDYC